MSQKISRHTASAMVRWRASSTEHNSLSDICRASSSKRMSCVSQRVSIHVVAGTEERGAQQSGEFLGRDTAVRRHQGQRIMER